MAESFPDRNRRTLAARYARLEKADGSAERGDDAQPDQATTVPGWIQSVDLPGVADARPLASSSLKSGRAAKRLFTVEEDALLIKLRQDTSLSWRKLAESFPGRDWATLAIRHKRLEKDAGSNEGADEAQEPTRTSPDGMLSLSRPGMADSRPLAEPSSRQSRVIMRFTVEEDTLLVQLRKDKALAWRDIAESFPGRDWATLAKRHARLIERLGVAVADDAAPSASGPPPSAREGIERERGCDRVECPFCKAPMHKTKLKRHLERFICVERPLPPDGIHDLAEIREMRGKRAGTFWDAERRYGRWVGLLRRPSAATFTQAQGP